MLKEAIESVLNSRGVHVRCWVYDDGSDFDVTKVVESIGDDRIILACAPRITPEERVRRGNTRWSTNMNWIVAKTNRGESITYLCDDDILSPDWLAAVDELFSQTTTPHLVIGDMYYFYDGEDPFKDGRWGFPAKVEKQSDDNGFVIWWNLGSFSHRTECFHDEGIRWRHGYKGHPHSWDVQYIDALLEKHVGYVKINIPAMYRREHKNTLSARAGRISDGVYVKPAEELKPEDVTGMME